MILKSLKILFGFFGLYCLYQAQTQGDPLSIVITAYTLGSIPFGLVVTRLFAGFDVRSIGSGNIGATNVLRSGHKILALLTLGLDMLKGIVAIFMASLYTTPDLNNPIVLFAAAAALLGHIYPVWLNFKGGKGIATLLGILITLSWSVALICVLIWILVAKVTRISSLAGLTAATLAPIIGYFVENSLFALFLSALTVLIYIRHKENIRRLVQGKEPRIGESQ